MKIFALALIAVVSADEKNVPPGHPFQRLAKLLEFSEEWCNDNLIPIQAEHWISKFNRNTTRFKRRFELCGFYDENPLPHGGPEPDRKRRSDDADDIDCDENGICSYDKENVIRGIKQITSGFRKWAEAYVSTCKLQPETQAKRADLWFELLANHWAKLNKSQ